MAINEAAVVRDYEGFVTKIAGKFAHRHGVEIEDLVQEGFIVLLRLAREWRPDGGASLATFSRKAIYLALRDYCVGRHPVRVPQRKERKMTEFPRGFSIDSGYLDPWLQEVLSEAPTQEQAIARKEERELMYKCVNQLGSKEKAVVTLAIEGQSFDDISRELDIPTQTAFLCYTRAIEQIRDLLEGKKIRRPVVVGETRYQRRLARMTDAERTAFSERNRSYQREYRKTIKALAS